MTYAALDVAKWFVNSIDRSSGESITHLKVQKLLYYAEGWTQLILDRELFHEQIQAWAHGPVVPDVFYALKQYGWNAIEPQDLESAIDEDAQSILNQVLGIYGEFSAKTLEHMTHAERPWQEARGGLPAEARSDAVIPKDKIKAYFYEKFHAYLEDGETATKE